jgi:hypothetical protein
LVVGGIYLITGRILATVDEMFKFKMAKCKMVKILPFFDFTILDLDKRMKCIVWVTIIFHENLVHLTPIFKNDAGKFR